MTELTLISSRKQSLKPLVEAALKNEIRLLESGIRRSQQRLKELEERYGLSTDKFIKRYENDKMKENLDLAEWIGEYRLLKRLQEKAVTLREIRFAN